MGQLDLKSAIAQAQPRTRTVRLCLRGDLLAQLDAATDEAEVTRLRAEVADATVEVRVRGLSYGEYRGVEASHPSKDGEGGWDVDTFPAALVRACLDAADDDKDALLGVLTSGQLMALFTAAIDASNTPDALPLPSGG